MDIVFLRWAKRTYKAPEEQWDLAAVCSRIFDALLDKFDAASLAPHANLRSSCWRWYWRRAPIWSR